MYDKSITYGDVDSKKIHVWTQVYDMSITYGDVDSKKIYA